MPRATQSKGKRRANDDEETSTPRRNRATQSSAQSQKKKRGHRGDDDDDDEAEGEDMDEDPDAGISASQGEKELVERANDLVRLALFAENNRTSIKRDEINKKVLGSHTRSFNAVFDTAQKILHKTFGMELVELMTRAERDKALTPDDPNSKKKLAATSKTYVLRSTLPAALIEASLEHNRDIKNASPESADDADEDEGQDDTLVAWRVGDDLASTGILHVILALILANGRTIPDLHLRALLKKLRIRAGVPLPQPARSTAKVQTLDTLLAALTKSGYLDKQKTTITGTQTQSSGRGRKRAAGGDDAEGANDAEDVEWKWGSRAIAEINEMGVAAFITDFMGARFGEREGGEEEEEDNVKANEERQKHEQAVMSDLVRSVGGPLMDIRSKRITADEEE